MDILTILIVILIVAWLLGGFVFPVGGSLIHILLVIVVIVVLLRVVQGRRL